MNNARPGNIYRMVGGNAFISHISDKGRAVGFLSVEAGVWYGPVSWNEHGISELRKSRFNIQDGKFHPGNCLAEKGDSNIAALAKPISELYKKEKS